MDARADAAAGTVAVVVAVCGGRSIGGSGERVGGIAGRFKGGRRGLESWVVVEGPDVQNHGAACRDFLA